MRRRVSLGFWLFRSQHLFGARGAEAKVKLGWKLRSISLANGGIKKLSQLLITPSSSKHIPKHNTENQHPQHRVEGFAVSGSGISMCRVYQVEGRIFEGPKP